MDNIITIKADVHLDGSLWVEHKGNMHFMGCLDDEEASITALPNRAFSKIKNLLK